MISDAPVTLSICIGAGVLWLVGGVAIGVLSALRRGTFFDRFSMGVALVGVSLPVFFTGLISLELFSYKWAIFPNVTYVGITQNPLLWARNLVLPWITLAFLYAALYARLTRAGMLETMSEDYIRTARAKGLPERKVIVKHGLRSALTPIVTIFGMDLGLLLGGAIITEVTFSLHGLGLFTFEGVVVGRHLAFVTDRRRGSVSFPGLYIGQIEKQTIHGWWQVPSCSQEGEFSFSRG